MRPGLLTIEQEAGTSHKLQALNHSDHIPPDSGVKITEAVTFFINYPQEAKGTHLKNDLQETHHRDQVFLSTCVLLLFFKVFCTLGLEEKQSI